MKTFLSFVLCRYPSSFSLTLRTFLSSFCISSRWSPYLYFLFIPVSLSLSFTLSLSVSSPSLFLFFTQIHFLPQDKNDAIYFQCWFGFIAEFLFQSIIYKDRWQQFQPNRFPTHAHIHTIKNYQHTIFNSIEDSKLRLVDT